MPQEYDMFVAIGYARLNRARAKKCFEAKSRGYRLASHHVEIGDNCFIGSHAVLSGHVKIGAHSFIGVNATLRDKITLAERTLVGAGALIVSSAKENTAHLAAVIPETGVPGQPLQSLL